MVKDDLTRARDRQRAVLAAITGDIPREKLVKELADLYQRYDTRLKDANGMFETSRAVEAITALTTLMERLGVVADCRELMR